MAAATGARILGRFFGNTVSSAAGFGAGAALGPVLGPPVRLLKNTINAAYPFEALAPEIAAAIVAEDVEQEPWGEREASFSGVGDVRFKALLGEARNAPGLPQLFELWRRDKISDADFTHGLRKAKLELRWDDPLKALKQRLLSLSDLANARQQGFVNDARQHSESNLQGLDNERADILFELSGLPLGVATMQEALNRGLVSRAEFDQAIREGHTKTKYTDLAFELRKPILNAADYAELHLRNWITAAEMNAGGALSGYTPAQMQLLYQNRGRPATVHQLLVGLRRGGEVGGSLAGIPQAVIDAVARSNIRPEYTNPLWHGAETYPSGFMIRGATQAGDITPAQAHALLFEMGWPAKWIDVFVGSWTGGTGSAGTQQTKAELLDEYAGGYVSETELRDVLGTLGYSGAALDREVHLADARRLRSLREKVVKVIGDAYLKHGIDATAATSELAEVNVVGSAATMLISLWDKERRFTVRELTDRQVARAVKKGLMSRDAGLAELTDRGYSQADAETELAL